MRRPLPSRRRVAQLQHLLQQYESASGKIIKTLTEAHKAALGKNFDHSNKLLESLDGVLEDRFLESLMDLNDTMAGVVGLKATAAGFEPVTQTSLQQLVDKIRVILNGVESIIPTTYHYGQALADVGDLIGEATNGDYPLSEYFRRRLEQYKTSRIAAQEPRWHDVGRMDAPVATIDIYQTPFWRRPGGEEVGEPPDFYEYKAYLSEVDGKPYDGSFGVKDYTEGRSATEAVKDMVAQWSRAGFLE